MAKLAKNIFGGLGAGGVVAGVTLAGMAYTKGEENERKTLEIREQTYVPEYRRDEAGYKSILKGYENLARSLKWRHNPCSTLAGGVCPDGSQRTTNITKESTTETETTTHTEG